jgi:prevent-host-death family protein
MSGTNLAEAKAKLSALVDRAAAGEPQVILRRGKPVAKIVAIETTKKRIDIERLRALTRNMPITEEVVVKMRREYRY